MHWITIKPDARSNWLSEGSADYDSLLPLGLQPRAHNPESIFDEYCLGVSTNRDDTVYDFSAETLTTKIREFLDAYGVEVLRYTRARRPKNVDEFLDYRHVKWSETLKRKLVSAVTSDFDLAKIRTSLYRPFCREWLYYDALAVDRPASFAHIFPGKRSTAENVVICSPTVGARTPHWCFSTNSIPNLNLGSVDAVQCFPFYTYAEDGTHRRENITDWALEQFRSRYHDPSIAKWDIFHYIYAVLHHPEYRERYAANLRRELPRVPFVGSASAFRALAGAGQRLAEIHVHYEQQPEYPLVKTEKAGQKLDYHVTKMKLSKDKASLIYNQFLTLSKIPPETYEYRLGNRSAIEWVIDQYQVSTDKRSGITNDPNRADDPLYILRLIGQVVAVSLETVKIVKSLPPWPAE